jgi:hypothetical protein
MTSEVQTPTEEFTRPSTYAIEKSWGGHQNFMASYGLKPGEEDEAAAIAEAMKDADEREYYERQSAGGHVWSGEDVDSYDRYEAAGVYAHADPSPEEEMELEETADAASNAATYDPDEDEQGGYAEHDPDEDGVYDDHSYDDPDENDYEDDEDY